MPSNKYSKNFITPELFDKTKKKILSGPNGWLMFVACNSGVDLAYSVKKEYENMLKEHDSELKEIPILGSKAKPITTIFPDTETCPRLNQHVAGSNVFVFQCIHENISGNTVNENIQQLLQVIRALRANRAKTISVVIPYIPYSRQDKPTFMQREATLASLFADQLKVAGADMCLTYHPHTLSLYGFYEPEMTLIALSGLDLFIEMFESRKGMKDVVAVSTDAGGAKFAVHYAEAMDLSLAIANKFRKSNEQTNLLGIIGDLENKKTAIITDDETVTGNSIINAVKNLNKSFSVEEIYVAISHFKVKKEYIPLFIEAHKEYGLKEIHITDTIPQPPEFINLDFVVMHPLAQRFSATINHLHYNQSVRELFYHGR